MKTKLRTIAQRSVDDPLVLWLVVGVLVAKGVLLVGPVPDPEV